MRSRGILIIIVSVIIAAGTVFEIISAVAIIHTTGILQIKTSDPKATLAISQSNHQAKYVGLGNASIRLEPGTYLVSAADQQSRIMESVKVFKKQLTTKTLNINHLIEQANKNNKLLKKLPVSGPAFEYSINYYLKYNNGEASPVITISSSSDKAKQDALQWMRYWGFDPADYQIVYGITAPLNTSYNYYVGGN